jgi:hypothetical protein
MKFVRWKQPQENMSLIRISSEVVIHENTGQAQGKLTKLLDILRSYFHPFNER